MEQYHVTGMNCAACSARVEKAVTKVKGVTSCSVSLLTNSMGVEGTAESSAVIEAVKAAGYGASLKNAKEENKETETGLEDTQTPLLKKRLIASVVFLIVLMYFSMGHMMWGWPLPAWFTDNHVGMGLVQMILAAIIMVINQQFFISGFKALWHRSPNMDTLVAMGSMASFVWSVYALLAMTRAQTDGNAELVMEYMMEFYFESAAMILTLITVGKMLEARSKGKTTDALKSLISLAPKTALIERDGKEVTVSIDEVQKGDIFVVRPGENIPVDGQVIEETVQLTKLPSQAKVFRSIRQKEIWYVLLRSTSRGFCAAKQRESVRIPHFPRSSSLWKMHLQQKHRSLRSQIRYPVFLYRSLSRSQ